MLSEAEDRRLWYPYNPNVLSAVTLPLIGWHVTALLSLALSKPSHSLSKQSSQSVEESLKALAHIAKIPQ